MLFKVTNIENSTPFVTGCTSCGILKGIWKDDTPPVLGKSYQIELSFQIMDRKQVTVNHSKTDAKIKIAGNQVIFTGICESIDEIYFIRFSFDGLEMLEIENDDFTIQEGDWISFSQQFHEIGIYPY
ncbi:MAG: hypothetical protein V3G42_02155 [Oscillospiraceae bacterium]